MGGKYMFNDKTSIPMRKSILFCALMCALCLTISCVGKKSAPSNADGPVATLTAPFAFILGDGTSQYTTLFIDLDRPADEDLSFRISADAPEGVSVNFPSTVTILKDSARANVEVAADTQAAPSGVYSVTFSLESMNDTIYVEPSDALVCLSVDEEADITGTKLASVVDLFSL